MKFSLVHHLTTVALAVAMWMPQFSMAGDGHDHGEAAPSTVGAALPRFTAVSEQFELVGVVNGTQVTFYLDHAETNAPVKDAKLSVELGGTQLVVKPHADGEFEAELAQALKPGVIPVTATVTTPKDTDLLAGELDLHEEAHAEDAHAPAWPSYLGWIAGAAAALAVLAWAVRRRAARNTVTTLGSGGAA
jgi:hypothetical protein